MESVRRGIGFLRDKGVDDPKTQPLLREAEAEDDVVRARHPQRAVGLEDAPLSVEQIASRLDDSFGLLTGGSRTAVPRQRTLRATMDWSHELLSEKERVLFHRLSVFAGSFTLEAAEAVCAGEGIEREDVLDLLSRLVGKSLVFSVAEQHQGGEEARHRLLETIRQYASEKLRESGEEDEVRRRHTEHYLALAEEADPELRGVWLERLEREHANLRAALSWAIEQREAELGLRLGAA